jgi:hypothetical protein
MLLFILRTGVDARNDFAANASPRFTPSFAEIAKSRASTDRVRVPKDKGTFALITAFPPITDIVILMGNPMQNQNRKEYCTARTISATPARD